jgi:hypothetical protein
MDDNDNTRGIGRGVGIGINKVRGKGRGKHKTTLSHSSIFQAPRPADTQPPHYTRQPTNTQQPQSTRQPTHHPISQTSTNFPPFLSTPSPQMSTIHAPTSQIPANIQSPHSTASPHLSTTHSPPHLPSGSDPLASSSSCDDSYPIAGCTSPTDRRILICLGPQLTLDFYKIFRLIL